MQMRSHTRDYGSKRMQDAWIGILWRMQFFTYSPEEKDFKELQVSFSHLGLR